jgi:cyclophilin family peptidyl-prolyl cis-trans isomerase
MNKTEKIKEDERGTAMVVWSFIVILIIAIVAIVIWSGGSGSGSSQSIAPISVTASTTDISSTTDNQIKNNEHMITIQTNKGTIVFETYDADAPNTVANFIKLANQGFYNGVIFHRVIQGFMIQGGDPTGTGRGGPGYTFADELNPATQSYKTGYIRGTVAMANAGPDTNGSQFFIVQKDTPLPNSYTIFGHVISGMDVVDAIAAVPVDANDKPLSPITMEKVTVATTSSTTAQ